MESLSLPFPSPHNPLPFIYFLILLIVLKKIILFEKESSGVEGGMVQTHCARAIFGAQQLGPQLAEAYPDHSRNGFRRLLAYPVLSF